VLTVKEIKLKDGSTAGIADYLKKDCEYYKQVGMDLPARWIATDGKIEKTLNDQGRDENQDLAEILAGLDPLTGEQRQRRDANSVLAFDCGTSVHKTFSIALASADDEMRQRMIDVLAQANDDAMKYVMGEMTSRTGKGGKGQAVKVDCVVRSVMHLDSREGDPQAHFHNLLINTGVDKDGKARALDGRTVMDLQKSAGAVFDKAVAQGFQQLGFGIVREEKEERGRVRTHYAIAGIGDDEAKQFSKRREQILAHVEEHGTSQSEANQKTRKRKDNELTPSQIVASTQQALGEMKASGRIEWDRANDLLGQQSQIAVHDEKQIFSQLHETSSAWTRMQLIEAYARFGGLDNDPIKQADDAIRWHMQEGSVMGLKRDHKGQKQFCTREQFDLEVEAEALGHQRRADMTHNLKPEAVTSALEAQAKELGYALSDEQVSAVRYTCEQSGGYALVQGLAGTGKSASAGAYVKAYQASGYTVVGASSSQVATENLASEVNRHARPDNQMQALNTTQLLNALAKGQMTLTDKHVILLDEAGMVDAKTHRDLLRHAEKAGAKMICVGDTHQLQPISAGNTFRYAQEQMSVATQSDIRRQQNNEHRDMAKAMYDEGRSGKQLLEEMKKQGMAVTVKRDAMKHLASAYHKDELPHQEKLVLASSHNQAQTLTKHIRNHLREDGLLGEAFNVNVRMDGAKSTFTEKEFCVNDRIRFTKNDHSQRLNNNDMGTILGYDARSKTMQVQMDKDESIRSVKLEEDNFFSHGYVRTSHSAQGLGANNVYAVASERGVNRNMALVNFTRTKQQFKIFGTTDQFEGMAKSLGDFQPKDGAQSLLTDNDRALYEMRAKKQQEALALARFNRLFDQETANTKAKHEKILDEGNKQLEWEHTLVTGKAGWSKTCAEMRVEKNNCDLRIARVMEERKTLGPFAFGAKKQCDERLAPLIAERTGYEAKHTKAFNEVKEFETELEKYAEPIAEAKINVPHSTKVLDKLNDPVKREAYRAEVAKQVSITLSPKPTGRKRIEIAKEQIEQRRKRIEAMEAESAWLKKHHAEMFRTHTPQQQPQQVQGQEREQSRGYGFSR
jgi:conjugative relaxase-like TrwC/TraI family protein